MSIDQELTGPKTTNTEPTFDFYVGGDLVNRDGKGGYNLFNPEDLDEEPENIPEEVVNGTDEQ